MIELLVQGPDTKDCEQFSLSDGSCLRLGRASSNDIAIPWDPLISRVHAELRWNQGVLEVEQLESGRNPLFYDGDYLSEFTVEAGGEFRIGNTRFSLVSNEPEPKSIEPHQIWESDNFRVDHFTNAERWLDILSQLPEAIAKAADDEEFSQSIVATLLKAIPRANVAAVLDYRPATTTSNGDDNGAKAETRILRWDSRETDISGFRPSNTLVSKAFMRRQSLLHVWEDVQVQGDLVGEHVTGIGLFDWAFCVPIDRQSSSGWCLYLTGNLDGSSLPGISSGDDLKEELRFSELLSQFLESIRQMRKLREQQSRIAQLFSPSIRESLSREQQQSIMEASESTISVLFVDVRTSQRVRSVRKPDLPDTIQDAQAVFDLTTDAVFDSEGVLADFQGTTGLGFWGWPVGCDDGALRACRAALRLHAQLKLKDANLNLRAGIAYGSAIAGKIGPDDQAKIGVFGPVVNLGARLRSLTKRLKTPILVDAACARLIDDQLPRSEGRCRRLGRFQLKGFDEPVAVSELLPEDTTSLYSDEEIAKFESAVDLVRDGRWKRAYELLYALPHHDHLKHLYMSMIMQHEYEPPGDWGGVFSLPS